MVKIVKAKKRDNLKHEKQSTKERVITYLLENKEPQSIRNLSGVMLVDYKNTYNIIKELSPDIIYADKLGNTTLIELKLKPNPQIYSAEKRRAEEFIKKHKVIELIKQDIESLNYPFLIALVFGSYARRKDTEKSDIDLCIISDNKEKTQELMSKIRLIPKNIEFHNFTLEEFESMIATKGDNLGKEIVKNNIILYGIENYYNLLSKWTKKERV